MRLPPGLVDPIFMHELAEHLHMTVGELCHGRGTPMSLRELSVGWPAYFDFKARQAEKRESQGSFTRRQVR
jgi:hypothetical protein